MSGDLVVTVLVGIVMVIGVAGTLLPVLPGLWLMWGAGAVFGLLGGFGPLGWGAMAALTVLAVGGTAAGYVVPGRRTSSIGVPWWGQLLAAVAAAIGFFLVPVVGAALGFLVGILAVSLLQTRSIGAALIRTRSVLASMAVASGVQFAAGLAMLVVWVVWALAR